MKTHAPATTDDRLKRSALWYAGIGWTVIPLHSIQSGRCTCGKADCASPGKHPRTGNGLKDATTDAGVIEGWWTQWPDANVAICIGAEAGIIAIDKDPRHGGDASMRVLVREHGELPRTVEAETGGGGRHAIFTHPGGVIRNRTNLMPGIDVRGDRGYIVAAPSVHISGNHYKWLEGHSPHEIRPAPLPTGLLSMLTEEVTASPAGRCERVTCPRVP